MRYCYASQSDEEVHPNVEGKVPKLQESIEKMFGGAEFSFDFIESLKPRP
jgi:hypothetical protein